jgi:hypothetical protein
VSVTAKEFPYVQDYLAVTQYAYRLSILGREFFFFSTASRPALGDYPAYNKIGTGGYCPRVKAAGA